jgi:hypothetical protein
MVAIPEGVHVAIMSPGRSVIILDMMLINLETLKISFQVLECSTNFSYEIPS